MIKTWKSYHNLAQDVYNFSVNLPKYDLYVGVPRSGMFPALILSELNSIDVSSLDYFIETEKGYNSGFRIDIQKENKKNILIIDDSYSSGASHNAVLKKINEKKLSEKYNIDYAAIYGGWKMPEYMKYYQINPNPQIFEWHIMTRENSKKWGVDIDGVLCPDPPFNEDENEKKYIEYIENAPLKFKPGFEIKAIITSRLGKYRKITSQWLEKNNIKYEVLCMAEYKNTAERKKNKRSTDKIKYLVDNKCNLMIESENALAEKIGKKIPSISIDNMTLYKKKYCNEEVNKK
jgi:hypoxanthine phosphoribosyltransferase